MLDADEAMPDRELVASNVSIWKLFWPTLQVFNPLSSKQLRSSSLKTSGPAKKKNLMEDLSEKCDVKQGLKKCVPETYFLQLVMELPCTWWSN